MSGSGYTKFTDYSHAELRRMAQALNPGEVMAASDPWRRAADTLKAIRTTLTRASTEAADTWEGSTSDAFHSRMLQLAATINNTASYANDAANTLKALSEAISKAKRDMPEEPNGWDQFSDGVGDTVSALFGGDDEDTKTAVADQKKAEAAAVMQTLAMHYRVAAPILKPPPPPPPPGSPIRHDDQDVAAQSDPSGAASFSAMMAGGAATGPVPTSSKSVPPPARSAADRPAPAPSGRTAAAAATDSGIKGGVAQAPPKQPSVTNVGPGARNDGPTTVTPPSTSGTNTLSANPAGPAGNPGTPPAALTSGGSSGGPVPIATGPVVGVPGGPGNGQVKGGIQSSDVTGRTAVAPGQAATRGGKAFGAGEAFQGGFGTGARAAAGTRPGGTLPGRTGGIVGEGGRPGSGPGAKQAFTEGGSGLGARSRLRAEHSANATGAVGPGMPLADAQRRKRNEEKDGKRPDYLVEDEETWASDKPTNPNVVE
ncbi:WXG100 family type VII secretion target [Kitasatospora sp. NPDC047058]|uniref:PPE domain-containing protein n=1 Tax=Kitasatospora sp. NPDC047058 TaxID=3155620 RepID=UPI0033D7777E